METQQVHVVPNPGTWRCLVCQKAVNQIRILPCQHKFCKRCLDLWAGIYLDMYHGSDSEFPCQVCWKLYAVPLQGLQAFEDNYQVRLLQESLQQMSMDQGQGHPTQGHNSGPFSYNPTMIPQPVAATTADNVMQQQNVFSDGMQITANGQHEPMGASTSVNSSPSVSGIPEPCQMDEDAAYTPGGSTSQSYPSMLSHMAPQTFSPTQGGEVDGLKSTGPGYCLRSCHMYMHMI